MGADAAVRPLADRIRATGKPVDPSLWRAPDDDAAASGTPARRGPRLQLYDLRPETALVSSPSG